MDFLKRSIGVVVVLTLGVVLGCGGQKSATSESASKAPATAASYDADLREFMAVTKSDSVAYQMAEYISASIIGSLVNQRRDVTQPQVMAAKQEVDAFLAGHIPALNDSIIAMYKRHYTAEDVHQLVAFFKTPAGVKFAQTTPIVVREGSMIGDRWGRALSPELGQRLMARLAKEGVRVQ